MSSSPSSSGRTRTRRFATSSFAARSRTGSTAPCLSGRYSARSIPPLACSTAPCTWPRAATTSRTGARIAIDRRSPAVCSTQAGCRRGADGIFSCGGQRLSLRFVTTAGRPPRAQTLTLIQAQLRAAGVEVVPVFAAAGTFFTQILPQGLFDVALFSWEGFPGGSRVEIFGCDAPQNYTGYCQRLVTARPQPGRAGSSTRVRKPESSTEPTGGSRVMSRQSRSTRASSRLAYDTSVRNFVFLPWNPFWNAENWWLDR